MSKPLPRAQLRVLATSDLHMHLVGFDYFARRPAPGIGLEGVACLIAQQRAECPNCLLMDNGDFLQGNPVGDWLAAHPQKTHPMIESMNRLGYDAVTLGNHDFNFGLPALERALRDARFAVVSSNLRLRRGKGQRLRVLRHLLLGRTLLCADGQSRDIAIGVIGLMPPQTVRWDAALAPLMQVEDLPEIARAEAAALRARGADLIVALAHSGICAFSDAKGQENAATAVAAMDVDAVVCGHTHLVFPGPGHPQDRLIDAVRGRLAGKPAVMPGFWGSHLGVISLELEHRDGQWSLLDSHTCALSVVPQPQPQPEPQPVPTPLSISPPLPVPALARQVADAARASHLHALHHLNRRIGRVGAPMHSFFALTGQDAGLRLVAQAQRWYLRGLLAQSRWRDLPVLCAVAPFRAGGRGGPAHYTDIPAGPLLRRHLADLYSFRNRLAAIEITGAELHDWLERASGKFCHLRQGEGDQALISPDLPDYHFDLVDGATWVCDLSQPARYDAEGGLLDATAQRVHELSVAQQPVACDDRFVLVTNDYRLNGPGLYAPIAQGREDIAASLMRGKPAPAARDILHRYIARRRRISPDLRPFFHFAPLGASALFETSPRALATLSRLAGFAPKVLDPGTEDFARLRLHL